MVGFSATRGVTVRLAVAAGISVVSIGLPFVVDASVRDSPFGAGMDAWEIVFMLLWLAVVLAALVVLGENRLWLGGAAMMSCLVGLLLANNAAVERTLAERGRTANCLVEGVAEEQKVISVYPYNFPTTEYVYHLQCPDSGPGTMTTDSPVADAGTSVAVFWDPSQRVSPRPAYSLGDYRTTFWLSVGATNAGAFLVLLDVLIDVRRRLSSLTGQRAMPLR